MNVQEKTEKDQLPCYFASHRTLSFVLWSNYYFEFFLLKNYNSLSIKNKKYVHELFGTVPGTYIPIIVIFLPIFWVAG
jgi:hypothetical protein